jgi:predicted Zn finger-like uncharacterized protein
MRLICPNCGAQYEVPSEVIPEGGRDVQCSNCAHTWFQHHPDQAEPAEPEPPESAFDRPAGDEEAGEDPAQREDAGDASAPPSDAEVDAPAASETPPAVASRPIDPEVAEVLREERELERRRRAAEAQGLETQPDLGLRDPDDYERARREREARNRMARLRGAETDTPTDDGPAPQESLPDDARAARAAAAGSRRELLPDVEEINQSLRSTPQSRAVDAADRFEAPDRRQAERSGFARGFFLVVLLAALAIGVYAGASQISEAVPAAGPALDSYVAQVDAARGWLDGQAASLMAVLDSMSNEARPDAAPDGDGG